MPLGRRHLLQVPPQTFTGQPVSIDLRSIIASKNPGLLKILPGFVIRIVERIVHVRDLNRVLRQLHDFAGHAFLQKALDLLGVEVTERGTQNLGLAGNPVIVANHPLGGLDGLALMKSVGASLGEIRVPANDLLLNIPQLRDHFVPVNKHGSNAGNLNRFDMAFASDHAVIHFPAGLCSRKKAGRVRDLTWQKSFVTRARRYHRDIVPVHIDGRNSRFFYGLARLRRWSGLKANLEMFFLVDEMFKQRGKTLTMTFGKPISWERLDATRSDWTWARLIRRHVYRLVDDPQAEFLP